MCHSMPACLSHRRRRVVIRSAACNYYSIRPTSKTEVPFTAAQVGATLVCFESLVVIFVCSRGQGGSHGHCSSSHCH